MDRHRDLWLAAEAGLLRLPAVYSSLWRVRQRGRKVKGSHGKMEKLLARQGLVWNLALKV